MALDPNLAALLTLDCIWQGKKSGASGLDKYGQDQWNDPVTLKCYAAYGSSMIQKKDGTVYASKQALIFDANDSNVQQFQLGDRFTSVGIAGGQTLEAQEIAPEYSPGPSLNQANSAWLVEVYL
ncbi:MAG TPA: hypothetical protein VJQ83_02160 [Tepidiformaceae bacterium]|nr:hypothetical protein [Tepidiformaceae bacterium]